MTRNLSKVQEALDALNPVQENINELKYYKKGLSSPNHSRSLCAAARSAIDDLAAQHTEVVNALLLYGTMYQDIDEGLAASNNPDYQPIGERLDFRYINAPEHQKGFWEKTWNQIILGDFSDDATWLGTGVNIVAAFFGVDALMDVRDFIANVSKGEWGWAIVSAISLIPVVGILGKGGKTVSKGAKALDTATDIIDAGATTVKQGSNLVDAGSTIIKRGSDIVDAGSSTIKQGSNLIDSGSDILKQSDGIIPKSMVDNYFNDIIKNSEFPQTIINDGSVWKKITAEQNDIMRTEFKKLKSTLINDWEVANNLKWPKYEADVFSDSGKLLRRAGDLYDAHHIRPLEFGGLNVFDNITPFNVNKHFDKKGIHAVTSPFGEIENLFK